MTVVQLRELARANKVRLPYGVNKAQMVETLFRQLGSGMKPAQAPAEQADIGLYKPKPLGFYDEEYGTSNPVVPQMLKAGLLGSGHGLLDPEDRETLQQREILLSDAVFDPLDNELQNIYACLAQPTERLTVSWPVGDISGAQLRPSFVVQRMEKLFPDLHVLREDGAYRRMLPATALELAGSDRALERYFRQRGGYDRVPVMPTTQRMVYVTRRR